MKHLAVVPARAGSKGIPGKNIKDLNGFPLLAYTASVAGAAACFDRIVLSTENPQFAELGKEWGLDVPGLRPRELAADHTTTREVVLDLLSTLLKVENYEPDFVTILQPTSPFRTVDELQEYDALVRGLLAEFDGVLGVVDVGHFHPQRVFEKSGEGGLKRFLQRVPQHAGQRRQDLREAYLISGSYFGFRTSAFASMESCIPEAVAPFFIKDAIAALNIDDPSDFEMARALLSTSGWPCVRSAREVTAGFAAARNSKSV